MGAVFRPLQRRLRLQVMIRTRPSRVRRRRRRRRRPRQLSVPKMTRQPNRVGPVQARRRCHSLPPRRLQALLLRPTRLSPRETGARALVTPLRLLVLVVNPIPAQMTGLGLDSAPTHGRFKAVSQWRRRVRATRAPLLRARLASSSNKNNNNSLS